MYQIDLIDRARAKLSYSMWNLSWWWAVIVGC